MKEKILQGKSKISKKVVMNTSCLIALSQIRLLNILCDIFDKVIIPKSVSEEFGKDYLTDMY